MSDRTSHSTELWTALVAAHGALLRALERESDCSLVGIEALGVLLPLAESPDGRLRMNELAARAGLTRSGLTRRIDRLVGLGLVERTTCPSDARGAYAAITAAGRRSLAPALAHHVEVLESLVDARLAPDETRRLIEYLGRLAESSPIPGPDGDSAERSRT